MFDLVLRNGIIVDGTRAPRYRADIALTGDRIAAIGNLADAQSHQIVDVSGLVVAPGFVDVHTHSDGWLLKTPHLLPKTMQGFTTEVLMADGISYAPVSAETAPEWLFYLRALDGLRMDEYRGWQSLGEFMQHLDRRAAQNSITHVPYANVRSLICGFGRGRVDDFQMKQMQQVIREGMEQGAVGLSTGLDYIVQCFSTTDELVDACLPVAEFDGLYVTHMRYKRGVMSGLREAVEIGRRAGVAVHISHLKAVGGPQSEEVLDYIARVAQNEVDFSFDVYPYQPGSTMLTYLLPYEVWEDGPLAVLSKLTDPAVRRKLALGLRTHRVQLDQIHIAWVAGKENSRHQGKLLSDYVSEMGRAPEDALADLLIEERLAVLLVFNEGADPLVHPFLQHEAYMMGSDGIYAEGGCVHPRMFGSAGRLLGPLVRDAKLFSLEDAVWKLSGRPAQRFGLVGRGEIAEGRYADLVVFDPESVTDTATYANPQQHTTGIEHVIVNGEFIIRDHQSVTTAEGLLPGRALRYRTDDA